MERRWGGGRGGRRHHLPQNLSRILRKKKLYQTTYKSPWINEFSTRRPRRRSEEMRRKKQKSEIYCFNLSIRCPKLSKTPLNRLVFPRFFSVWFSRRTDRFGFNFRLEVVAISLSLVITFLYQRGTNVFYRMLLTPCGKKVLIIIIANQLPTINYEQFHGQCIHYYLLPFHYVLSPYTLYSFNLQFSSCSLSLKSVDIHFGCFTS